MELTISRDIFSTVAALLFWALISLYQTYLRVRDLGLPILFNPFGRLSRFWIVFHPYVAPSLTKLSKIGGLFHIFSFIEYSTGTWFFTSRRSKNNPHSRYGSAFFIISPRSTQLIIADVAAAEQVQARRKDFVKDETMYKSLDLLGPNVVSTNGETWARHRRITTPPFSERNSSVVWKESLVQASGMLKRWVERAGNGVENIPNDTMMLALNVLMTAGFEKRYDFESNEDDADTMGSYREAH